MNLRESNYRLDFDEKLILPFEEKVLASGLCDFALPMAFITSRGTRTITYDCSGYTGLDSLPLTGIRDIYQVLEKTLITLSKAGEFLIDPNKMVLTKATVFYHLKYKDVKLAYVPDPDQGSIYTKVGDFIESLGENGDENIKEYLVKTKNHLERANLNIVDAINYIGVLKREIYLCGFR